MLELLKTAFQYLEFLCDLQMEHENSCVIVDMMSCMWDCLGVMS